jgi:kinesin family protein 6/9
MVCFIFLFFLRIENDLVYYLIGTIMCYGQTGAGKTHTMTGFTESYQNRGIIPRSLQHLYQEINARQDLSYSIR